MNPIIKANKETVLNYATNRWLLNQSRNVGPTSKSIRECKPSNIDEWRDYYYKYIRPRAHIDKLGRKLYTVIKDIVANETRFHPDLVESINLGDCIDYMHNLVIKRVHNGYEKEMK